LPLLDDLRFNAPWLGWQRRRPGRPNRMKEAVLALIELLGDTIRCLAVELALFFEMAYLPTRDPHALDLLSLFAE
jgi:hypothetical protein